MITHNPVNSCVNDNALVHSCYQLVCLQFRNLERVLRGIWLSSTLHKPNTVHSPGCRVTNNTLNENYITWAEYLTILRVPVSIEVSYSEHMKPIANKAAQTFGSKPRATKYFSAEQPLIFYKTSNAILFPYLEFRSLQLLEEETHLQMICNTNQTLFYRYVNKKCSTEIVS